MADLELSLIMRLSSYLLKPFDPLFFTPVLGLGAVRAAFQYPWRLYHNLGFDLCTLLLAAFYSL